MPPVEGCKCLAHDLDIQGSGPGRGVLLLFQVASQSGRGLGGGGGVPKHAVRFAVGRYHTQDAAEGRGGAVRTKYVHCNLHPADIATFGTAKALSGERGVERDSPASPRDTLSRNASSLG